MQHQADWDAQTEAGLGSGRHRRAGIAGMQAALDLAQAGYRVFLIEQGPAIGGRMVQLDKTFPTNDCSMCTISPRLVEIQRHPNIELSQTPVVTGLEGKPGDFELQAAAKPTLRGHRTMQRLRRLSGSLPGRIAERVRSWAGAAEGRSGSPIPRPCQRQ